MHNMFAGLTGTTHNAPLGYDEQTDDLAGVPALAYAGGSDAGEYILPTAPLPAPSGEDAPVRDIAWYARIVRIQKANKDFYTGHGN